MKRHHFPERMPGTEESPAELLARTVPLVGTPGQSYVERRGIPLEVADAAGVRFAENFAGRPVLLVALRNQADNLVSVHGRYLHTLRRQSKMLSIGPNDGIISVLQGWRAEPMIIVEGLFDALSLGTCGLSSSALIGRRVSWLPEVSASRVVWLAFDTGKPGEADVIRYREILGEANVRRLPPPPQCKDWNTALIKRGPETLVCWVHEYIRANDTTSL